MHEKLNLKFQKPIQGKFKAGQLNLLFVFQVNCPGCFQHGFPITQQVYEKFFPLGLNVLGLSTAFEDFELNTLQNTKKLLSDGTLTGETKKAYEMAGVPQLPYSINFPVAFDYIEKMNHFDLEDEADRFCQVLDGFEDFPVEQKLRVKKEIHKYLLNKQFSAFTFDRNHLQGTPTWILFDQDYNILFSKFGRLDSSFLEKEIEKHISSK